MSIVTMILVLMYGGYSQDPSCAVEHEPARKVSITIVTPEKPLPEYQMTGDGLIAVRDAGTGELRAPTPREQAEINAAMAREMSFKGKVTEIVHDDGTISAVVGSRFQSYSVVVRTPKGESVSGCVDHADEIEGLLRTAMKASKEAAREEK